MVKIFTRQARCRQARLEPMEVCALAVLAIPVGQPGQLDRLAQQALRAQQVPLGLQALKDHRERLGQQARQERRVQLELLAQRALLGQPEPLVLPEQQELLARKAQLVQL